MTTVHVLMLADAQIQDAPDETGKAPDPRHYAKDQSYAVDDLEARRLISGGFAALVEVPAQPGMPLGCLDGSRLDGELRALAPKPKPPTEPVPLPAEAAPAAEGVKP